jgi:hypothetical protein
MKDNGKPSLQDRLRMDIKTTFTIISFRISFNCKEVNKWL